MKKISLLFLFIALSYNSFAQFNLEDLWVNYSYYPESVDGFTPMNDGETYTMLEDGYINLFSYKTGKFIKTIVSANDLIPAGASKSLKYRSYEFSSDETKVLIATEIETIYRHSFKADYWIYSVAEKKLTRLSKNGKQQLATFSPDGSKIAFVRDNNLFYTTLSTNSEVQITKDGLMNQIINGAPDWVYEEEFSFSKAFAWSPDSKKIAFIRFDESKVKQFSLTYFGDLYPREYEYKYPKAGEDNSIVSVFVYDLMGLASVKMDIGENTDIYIPRIQWTKNANILSIQRLNRLQNKFEILLADATNGSSKILYSEENKYYIDITDNLTFLNNEAGFLLSSEADGYNHLYHYDMNGKLVKQLTKGEWDVLELKGFDEKSGDLFFTSSENGAINTMFYKVNIKTAKKNLLSTKPGSYSVEFSANYKYYLCTFTDANTPPYISMNKISGEEMYVLETNNTLKSLLTKNGYAPKEFFMFKNENGDIFNAWMIKPLDFDSTKRYPVLMYVYGGPGSQTVQNSWGYFDLIWFQMLAQKGYIIVSVDNRGTGARGQEFKKCTYLNLGKFETDDQISGAKYLGNLKYVDAKRIGIFGWSYGGYMSTLCMTKGANYFKTGIAVAPVTNWRYYDNIYTERFMRTPKENANGYDDNSPISHVQKMKGKFLLVHGITDDNVHVQNSMDLITKLVANNKQFEMQFYPNNDHGIRSGRNTRFHLYTRMTKFLLENL